MRFFLQKSEHERFWNEFVFHICEMFTVTEEEATLRIGSYLKFLSMVRNIHFDNERFDLTKYEITKQNFD